MTTHQSPAALAAEAKRLADALAHARAFRHLGDPERHALHAAIDQLAALASQAREAAEVPAWINVSDQMPPPGRPVLVVYETHHTPPRERINRAQWIPAKFEEADSDGDNFEYDEETDTNWTPAGWYECMDHWEEYGYVAMAGVTVTRWMPLPPLTAAPPAPAAVVREGWVSIADGLPEKNTEVLVFFEGVSTLASTGQYTASASDHDGWCYPRENYDDERDEWPKVTHWQPLPAAPLPAASKGKKE